MQVLDTVRSGRFLAASACGLAIAASAAAILPERVGAGRAFSLDLGLPTPSLLVDREVAFEPAAPAAELLFAFSAGGDEYVRLTDDVPAHGPPRLADGERHVAIADVDPASLPDEARVWLGRAVRVDGSCDAHVVGFAVIARLSDDTREWTADRVLDAGAAMLAARLDHCDGSYAREAALPDPIVPVKLDDRALAARARAALFASEPALAAQREWSAAGEPGRWQDTSDAEITTQVVRHPATGARWVAVHALVARDCGAAHVNVWGLYRVDGAGNLVADEVRTLDTLERIDQLIDLDGDGRWELLGRGWLGLDRVVARGNGEVIDQLSLPYLGGCTC